MNQLLPGLYHWKAHNDWIDAAVDSYFAKLDANVLIDPLVPEEGTDWFGGQGVPHHVVMTNRLHDRSCQWFIDEFGATVWCHRAGLHEFEDGSLDVRSFEHGDELPGGILTIKEGVLCPEETVLYLPIQEGVLAIGDAIVRWGGELTFVPDHLLGDDPAAIKKGIRNSFRRICNEHDFDHLLFAHGDPLIGGGRQALTAFVDSAE